jgi:undecaprenyl phosphate-alpha-L-ara4N flippase subunit ArnF
MAARPSAWFFNPYVQLAAGAALVAAADVMVKLGATDVAAGSSSILGFGALASSRTWIGIILYVLSFVSWLYVLRLLPLSEAFALMSITHVLVPAASWLFLGEAISVHRMIGIGCVLGGTVLMANAAAVAEERL